MRQKRPFTGLTRNPRQEMSMVSSAEVVKMTTSVKRKKQDRELPVKMVFPKAMSAMRRPFQKVWRLRMK